MEVREISDDPEVCEMVWQWHQRRPGFDRDNGLTFADMIGAHWWHYLFSFDGTPLVCVSANEHRPHGFEIHVAAASGTHPARTIEAVQFVGDRLMADPECRLASWCPAKHRAAVRLNKHFLTYETSEEINGERWNRYGSSSPEWWKRHGKESKSSPTSFRG